MKTGDVVVADDRPAWVKKEDAFMTCWSRCSHFKGCQSRFGFECKHQGGDRIPKLTRKKGEGDNANRKRKGEGRLSIPNDRKPTKGKRKAKTKGRG